MVVAAAGAHTLAVTVYTFTPAQDRSMAAREADPAAVSTRATARLTELQDLRQETRTRTTTICVEAVLQREQAALPAQMAVSLLAFG
jgi:hypothetical protein